MNKSTPLNQLPHQGSASDNAGASSAPFMTDQQRQLVSHAQQAAQSFTMPQSTQTSHDVVNLDDDDSTVQEVLQQLNQTIPGHAPPPPPAPPAAMPPSSTEAFQQHNSGMQTPTNVYGYGSDSVGSYAGYAPQQSMMFNQASPGPSLMGWTSLVFDQDFKLLLLVAVIYVTVTILPVENFVYQYIALNKFPYASILVKAALCAVAVYIGKKLFISVHG
jgi:hypothetical protein